MRKSGELGLRERAVGLIVRMVDYYFFAPRLQAFIRAGVSLNLMYCTELMRVSPMG